MARLRSSRPLASARWAVFAILAVIISPGIALAEAALATMNARGSFEVTVKPEGETRFAMTKRFSGAMTGTSEGTMIGDRVVDAYAALERFRGTVDGRSGEFVLLHRGYRSDADGMNLDIIVAPNSGTGELAGIQGKLAIEIKGGEHVYNLSYSLPPR